MPSNAAGPLVRALALSECQAVAQALVPGPQVHESVHVARKAIRRLRALLALLERTALDLERADGLLRRLGDGLSALRDAHVAVETAARLGRHQAGPAWAGVVLRLQARRDAVLQRALNGDPGFARRQRSLQRIAGLLEAQDWACVRPLQIRDGLRRSAQRAAKAEKRARASVDPEVLHRWRRKVRRLRMQLEAMPQLDAALAKAHGHKQDDKHTKALHRLSDHLGRQQDLRLLRSLLRAMRAVDGKKALLMQLDAALQDGAD